MCSKLLCCDCEHYVFKAAVNEHHPSKFHRCFRQGLATEKQNKVTGKLSRAVGKSCWFERSVLGGLLGKCGPQGKFFTLMKIPQPRWTGPPGAKQTIPICPRCGHRLDMLICPVCNCICGSTYISPKERRERRIWWIRKV